METAEFIMKIVTIGALTLGIVGMILQTAAFQGEAVVNERERLSIDLLQAATLAPCAVEQVDGEGREGLFVASKLDAMQDFCLMTPFKYHITVIGEKTWDFGNEFSGGYVKRAAVAIKYADRTVPGELVVTVQ